MRIPFRRKSTRSDEKEDADTNKEKFQSNQARYTNISKSEKNSHPSESSPESQVCFACKNVISGEIKKPEWKWNVNSSQSLCINCYDKKSTEYEKINNYCNECNKKLGFIRYNPKPLWGMNGQLCRTCWDLKNSTFKK